MQEVIIQVKGGNTNAFACIVRTFQQRIRAYLAMRGIQPMDVDELAQDVFVTAFRRIDAFDEDREVLPWLLGIARNLSRQAVRKQIRQPKMYPVCEVLSRLDEAECEDSLGEEDPLRLRLLQACMDKLSEKESQLLHFRYFTGPKADGVAPQAAMKPGAVRIALHRIRQKLRSCVEKQLVQGPVA